MAWRVLEGILLRKSETFLEDSSIRTELGLSLKIKFMKQEFSPICPEWDADEESTCHMGKIENN